MATQRFFQLEDFISLQTPLITTVNSRGNAEIFQVTTLLKNEEIPCIDVQVEEDELVKGDLGDINYFQDFFERPTFLTVSGKSRCVAH